MHISWHGHSCFIFETFSKHKLIIDPFIKENPLSDLDINQINVDYIVVTHAHNDHFGDTIELAKKTNASVISTVEICQFLNQFDIDTIGMNIGGQAQFPFGSLKLTPAFHSSSLNYDGKTIELGLASGIILDDGYKKIYHAGDTALFSDMSLIAPVDCALLPIGDHFTMGIEDAVKAVELIKPKKVIPMHYNTFDLIKQNPYQFAEKVKNNIVYIPKIGELIKI